jgi:putative glutamine amidotransferase
MRPLIAVAWPKTDYVRALEHAGADVRVVAPADHPVADVMQQCDGLLLTGGVDVDPAEYGENRHPTVEVDAVRDQYELALTRAALEADFPILAICRGAQVLNVAAGGTLVQDLPSQTRTTIDHSIETTRTAIAHPVSIAPESCLAALIGRRAIDVNSRHHQSVKDLAAGFVITATAPDGVVEAIEKPGSRFCLGVQWHPENFWATGEFKSLFDGLVRAAVEHRHDLDVRRVRK